MSPLQIEVGYRMPAPTDTPNEVNGVMQQCWQYDPEERPDFATLLNMLTDAAAKIKTLACISPLGPLPLIEPHPLTPLLTCL